MFVNGRGDCDDYCLSHCCSRNMGVGVPIIKKIEYLGVYTGVPKPLNPKLPLFRETTTLSYCPPGGSLRRKLVALG